VQEPGPSSSRGDEGDSRSSEDLTALPRLRAPLVVTVVGTDFKPASNVNHNVTKVVRYMPALRKDGGATDMCLANEKKVETCAQSIWTEEGVSREPREDCITHPFADADADGMALANKDEITPAEVHKILRHLSLRKAPDSTGASNVALRLLAAGGDEEKTFETFLARLFTLCLPSLSGPLETGSHPHDPQAGQGQSLSLAGVPSRCCLSSALEKILAARLKEYTVLT
jgi:hypothetical protein